MKSRQGVGVWSWRKLAEQRKSWRKLLCKCLICIAEVRRKLWRKLRKLVCKSLIFNGGSWRSCGGREPPYPHSCYAAA